MVRNVRIICFVEGISCILLFFIAMPLKYVWGDPRAVSIVGMGHGVLWVAVVGALFMAYLGKQISIRQAATWLFVSTFPLGMFWVDKQIVALEQSISQE